MPAFYRSGFEALLDCHDKEVDQYCATLEITHRNLVAKQIQLSQTFEEMIDEVIQRASDAAASTDSV
jgi:RNAse (barnase) inhibitor barstar